MIADLPDFMANVHAEESGCWIWNGRKWHGYGRYKSDQAHRASYEHYVGPIPQGLEVDHTCRQPMCVNPAHLESVTRAENIRRRYADYTHCRNGHEYTQANTYRMPNGRRDCRACIRIRAARYKARKLAAGVAS